MSTDSPHELLKQWHAETLTLERGLGQLLQHLIKLYDEIRVGQERRGRIQNAIDAGNVNWANLKLEVDQLKNMVKALNANVEQLLEHTGLPPVKITAKPKG
jgi:glycogen synthase